MAIIWVGTGRFNAYIGPVQDYIDRVVARDVAAGNSLGLEVGVRDAYDVFIRDSLDTGHLGSSGGVLSQANSIIKAAPIMCGARTRAGALTPLVGPVPTDFGTAGGWNYNRKRGLAGNGTDNYLDSGRAGNADPQDSHHLAVRADLQTTGNQVLAGTRNTANGIGGKLVGYISSSPVFRSSTSVDTLQSSGSAASGTPTLFGLSRSSSAEYAARVSGSSFTIANTSAASASPNLFIFAQNTNGTPTLPSSAYISFYSIGENLTLSTLDTRLTTLMAAIQAAIPT